MKINKKQGYSKKYLFIGLGLVLLICSAAVTYVYGLNGNLAGWTKPNNQSSVSYDTPTDEQKQAGQDTKEKSINNTDSKPTSSGSDQVPAPVPQPDGKNKVEVSITAANQNGTTLQLRSLVLAVVGTGTCKLTLAKGTGTVTKTAPVQAMANSATCQGFDIPVSELSPGNWQATLTFENESLTGTASKQITIQ